MHHAPHPLDVIAGVSPIALGIEIAEKKAILHAIFDIGHGAGDFARHKGLAANRAFMVEENSVRRVKAIGLAVVHRDPISIELGGGVGRTRIKRRRLALRDLLDLAIELGG